MSATTFFADSRNVVVSGGTFTAAHTINHNTYVCFGVNEGERVNPIPAPQGPNSTPAAFVPNSCGDIVTTISIMQSIYMALRDSAGSSSEYTCLIEELRSFEVTLRLIGGVLQTTSVSKNLRQVIEAETTRCLNLLRKFWERTERYEAILSGRWTVREVQRFRRKLSRHKQNIAMFLELQNATASFHAIQQRPPTGVGFDLENALILIDALGERITLPMQFCFSRDELHKTLIRLFKGKIGESLVERRQYAISTKDGNSLVASDNWGAMVKKGTVIVMSAIVKKVALRQERGRRQRNACPRCYETPVGVMPDDGWLQCRRCAKRFSCIDSRLQVYRPPAREANMADFHHIHVMFFGRSKFYPQYYFEEEEKQWEHAEAVESDRFLEVS